MPLRLLKSTKYEVFLNLFLTNLDSSYLAVAELVNMKTQVLFKHFQFFIKKPKI